MIALFLLFTISLIFHFKSNKVNNFCSLFLSFIVYIIVIGFVTYNNDWNTYEFRYNNVTDTHDVLYNFLFYNFKKLNFLYKDFYLFNQVLNIVLLLLFIRNSKNANNSLLVILVVLVMLGSTASILLRFFTCYLFFINAVYYYNIKNRRFIAIILFVLSFTAHFGSAIMIIMFLLSRYINMKYLNLKYILFIGFIIALLKNIIFEILTTFSNSFIFYTESDSSSIEGGILVALPSIIWFLLILFIAKMLEKKTIIDELYLFLYYFSILPFFLLITSFKEQIILLRYIEPFIIFWVSYIVYSLRFFKIRQRIHLIIFVIIITFISLYIKYYLPFEILGISEWYQHYNELLESNRLNIF